MMDSIDVSADGADGARQEVIRRVLRAAIEDCEGDSCSIAWMLESCVETTVDQLWSETSVKTFVPLLAMRGVKDCIAAGECPTPMTLS